MQKSFRDCHNQLVMGFTSSGEVHLLSIDRYLYSALTRSLSFRSGQVQRPSAVQNDVQKRTRLSALGSDQLLNAIEFRFATGNRCRGNGQYFLAGPSWFWMIWRATLSVLLVMPVTGSAAKGRIWSLYVLHKEWEEGASCTAQQKRWQISEATETRVMMPSWQRR